MIIFSLISESDLDDCRFPCQGNSPRESLSSQWVFFSIHLSLLLKKIESSNVFQQQGEQEFFSFSHSHGHFTLLISSCFPCLCTQVSHELSSTFIWPERRAGCCNPSPSWECPCGQLPHRAPAGETWQWRNGSQPWVTVKKRKKAKSHSALKTPNTLVLWENIQIPLGQNRILSSDLPVSGCGCGSANLTEQHDDFPPLFHVLSSCGDASVASLPPAREPASSGPDPQSNGQEGAAAAPEHRAGRTFSSTCPFSAGITAWFDACQLPVTQPRSESWNICLLKYWTEVLWGWQWNGVLCVLSPHLRSLHQQEPSVQKLLPEWHFLHYLIWGKTGWWTPMVHLCMFNTRPRA